MIFGKSKFFNKKTILAVLGAVFLFGLIGSNAVKAETSLPFDSAPPPMPPHVEACYNLMVGTPVGSTTNGEARMAIYYNCIAEYWQEAAAYQERTRDWWYRRQEYLSQSTEFKIKLAAMGALLDSMAYLTTNFAYDTANMILGVDRPDGKPSFYEDPFGEYLEYHADQAAGVFFERFDEMYQFSADFGSGDKTEFGFTTLCKKPSPLDIRLGLGLGDMGPLQGSTCTISAMVDNFESISDMVSSGEALRMHRVAFEPYGNDLHVGLELQSNYVDAILSEHTQAKLARQESEGMVPVIDKITQRIKWPSLMANEGMRNLEPTGMAMVQQDKQQDYMVQAFWEAGLEGLGFLTLSTFLNRLAFGFLEKILTPSEEVGGTSYGDQQRYNVTFYDLTNEDSTGETQNYYERQAFAKSLGDFIVPSFFSQKDQDLVTDLSSCPPVRSQWNCAMDQQLAIAINLGTRDGALTVGKASGIGNENSSGNNNVKGLHADWELIPESDVTNNTDPSCYQRAYCAGNLKKLRLARILPIGFEMAANSPYNVKHNGKYVTLGEVIRGYYDCNDNGQLDKDHPWCHLIDPNWILTAPKYQCRSEGYGDELVPELGTRQVVCGDMVSCLGTDQSNNCVKGYGYCLAERPVYKFDAPECNEQYASCRTYVSSKGDRLSALRYTVERGACSEENIGCMWYSTLRYAPNADTPDGLWVGTLNDGPRVYLDGGAEACSSEGCTKVYNVEIGESAFNLIKNGSFEDITEVDQNGVNVLQSIEGWSTTNANYPNVVTFEDSFDGSRALSLASSGNDQFTQVLALYPNRNYTLSFYFKSKINYGTTSGHVNIDFFNDTVLSSANRITTEPANFEDCFWDAGANRLTFNEVPGDQEWHRLVCQFVSPEDVEVARVYINLADFLYLDALQLEEGEYATDFVEDIASLNESHIKIAPDEYQCTGDDDEDNPACARFARVCRQTEVGCQGYTSVDDPTAPEIPATLTAKDYCPSICSGYGEYRKLASAFDLVQNPVYPEFNDPEDNGKAYIIPDRATTCSLAQVGCEPFTNLEPAQSGGEQVAYYSSLRSCQKPNELSKTYFTWEGSDAEGYVLRTWALIASSTTDNAPKIMLKGAQFGDIKDPANCNEGAWVSGLDQDCRQFYDEAGNVYYAYYSQTISSSDSCTLYRKDDSSQVDCAKTGGHEYLPESASCLYYALPSQSFSCSAVAGGCRAYLGPTGRNAVQTYYQDFVAGDSTSAFSSAANSGLSRSEESVIVGDFTLRIDSSAGSAVQAQTDIPLITTTTLYRVSFWAKSLVPGDVAVSIDGMVIGNIKPTTIWQRFEIGPFEVEDETATLAFNGASSLGSLFVDTIKLDQLNDIRFLVKNSWTIPAACDATAEGTPEPRAMLGCAEYVDRDGNQIFAKSFSNLCRADSIGCKAFVDTRSVSNPYPQTRTINGTPGPSPRQDADAKAYEEQYLGDWSITSPPWRYYYAIDDSRARCDESQASCRAFGKPKFTQDRLGLNETGNSVDPADTELLQTQDQIYEFETVLLKHDWDAYYKEDGSLNLACRKDELHCEKYQSGNVTEYFRDPGDHTCEWRDGKAISANPEVGIYTDGTYGGWFRSGTDIPCYPGSAAENKAPYLKNGDVFGAYFNGEDPFAGWVSKCPVDQSECTEFVDPNDTSDPNNLYGRSYYLINTRQIDTRSCGGTAEPLAGCVLFNNRSITDLFANSKATYEQVNDERGAAQNPIDCEADPGNPYCLNQARCGDFTNIPNNLGQNNQTLYSESIAPRFRELQQTIKDFTCQTDTDCSFPIRDYPNGDAEIGTFVGKCLPAENDSNVVIKVKLDRECARWMGCETGETVFDPAQQKYVTQCNELQLCEANGSANDDIYCADFTDRDTEPLLTEGQFISLESYSSRKVGYGAMDYSGYTIPNQYLLPDITPRAIGYDILPEALKQNYQYDKRLVAAIPANTNSSINYLPANPSYPDLDLCQDTRTGRVGYLVDDVCYLAINEPQALSFAVGGQQGKDVSRDITEIYKYFMEGNVSRQNSLMQNALPAPECQLYPEASSPLSNEFVEKWNSNSVPPVPEKMVDGYDAANACVYGEDCSCSYRKVRYQGGVEQFYSIDGKPPAVGICVGGDKEGQSCVPGGFVPVDASDRVIANTSQGLVDMEASQCGGNGICSPIQDVVIQNGLYAYCLERDRTRVSGVSQANAPCLAWSPLATIGGQYDTKHYAPTASYLPPQGSGEYYCMSGANEQRIETPSTKIRHDEEADNTWEEDFWMPGKLWEFAFARNEVWWVPKESSASNVAIDGSDNITFIGSTPQATLDRLVITTDEDGDPDPSVQKTVPSNQTKNLRFACRRATICEGRPNDNDDLDFNDKEGRWIMTGDSLTNSYMEYFIPSGPGINWINENYYDYRYGLFRFSLMPYAAGTACKWNPKWVGMDYPTVDQSKTDTDMAVQFSCQNYLQQTQQNSQQFYSQFQSKFPGILDRSTEKILRDDQGTPVKMKCAIGTDGTCYYKYWETGYQNDNQEQFRWPFAIFSNKMETFSFKDQYKSYYSHECNAGSPYFGIRAVFQNVNKRDNRLEADEAKNVGFEGPWQFIGFWFTTCLPTDRRNDPGWLYMRMDTVTADVCREVGQVIAPESREKAAFMDRVWSQGNFLLPVLGLTYDSRNEPHGAALATNEIGSDPILLGASVPTSGALNKAPGFVDSGVTTAAILSQQNSWVPLTNLFARVYKVYRWDPNPVESGDWTCIKGSQKGKSCYVNSNQYDGLKVCGDYATCDPDIDVNIKNQNWRCNTLSGVNRGLRCGENPYPARNTDPVCHNAAVAWNWNEVKMEEETIPLLTSCEKTPGAQEVNFSIPLKDFGRCWIQYSGYTLNYAFCHQDDNSQVNGGYDADDVMNFRLIKCTNRDSYFAYPLYPTKQNGNNVVSFKEGNGPTLYDNHYDLWHDAYEMMIKAISASGATNIDLNLGTATCGNDPITTDLASTQGRILDALKILPRYDEDPIREALDKLYDTYNVPNDFELGYWTEQTAGSLSLYRCAADAVNAGARCALPAEISSECPLKIAACGSSEYQQIKDDIDEYINNYQSSSGCFTCQPPEVEYPPCGYCSTNDPLSQQQIEDQYLDLYPGTGFCKGRNPDLSFNPLSRCRTNSDCVFTEFEYWGTEDLGQAKGRRFTDEGAKLISYDDEGSVLVDARAPEIDLALPLPLFNGKNEVPDVYSEPARLEQAGHNDDAIGIWGVDTCKDEIWHNLCKAFTELSSTDEANDAYKACENLCAKAYQLLPNSYAEYFDIIVDSTANTQQRTAAIAPFAVDPSIRNKLSRGQVSIDYGGTSAKVNMRQFVYYLKGIPHASDFYGNPFRKPWTFWNFLSYSIPDSINVAKFIDAGIYKKKLNDSFPWRADKLFFTTIYPLAINNGTYSQPETIDVDLPDNGYFFDQYWEGYGMSRDLLKVFKDLLDEEATQEEKDSYQKAYNKQFGIDMEENFFSKTGWGAFLTHDNERLQLYPGAIPAAVPREDDRDEYAVYFPGHCEPPIGGTDTDSVDGELENIALADQGKAVALGFPDAFPVKPEVTDAEKWQAGGIGGDKTEKYLEWGYYLGLRFDEDAGWVQEGEYVEVDDPEESDYPEAVFENEPEFKDELGLLHRPFLMPWETNIDLDFLTQDYFKEANEWGTTAPENYTWTAPYVQPKQGVEETSIPITCDNCSNVINYRNTCRCVGGKRNGTVQESQADCNLGLPDSLNPDKLSPAERAEPSDYCKPNASFIDGAWVPIPECQAPSGIPNHEDPDLDDNMCTHRAGYVPRGDVCADGGDNCLVTYNVSDPVSTDHINKDEEELAAPSATDVTGGLDTFWYLTGGKVQKLNKEYSAWYRPRPPQVAAPDMTRSGTKSNSLPIASMDAFSLDGLPAGLVYYGGGQGLATIRFYAWAMHDQGPLKSILIDWGDGSVQEITNAQMKNAKPVCNTNMECEFVPGLACGSDADCPAGAGACMELGNCKKQSYKTCREDSDCGNDDSCEPRIFFGNSTEACRQGYFEFQHVYRCNDEDLSAFDRSCGSLGRCSLNPDELCNVSTDCPRDDEQCVFDLAPSGGCYLNELNRCRYTPRIQVKDNWGWCTGDCSRDNEPYPGGPQISSSAKDRLIRHPYSGCYDGSNTKINEEVMSWTGGAPPESLINECSLEPVNDLLRPWIIYDGAIEIEDTTKTEVNMSSGLYSGLQLINTGGFNISGSGISGIQLINP